METEGSLLCSQEPANGLPVHTPTSYFCEIPFHIIFLYFYSTTLKNNMCISNGT